MKRKPSPKVRITLDLPAQDSAVLERLAHDAGSTRTEMLKRGIALLDTALAAKAKGRTLALASGDKLIGTIII